MTAPVPQQQNIAVKDNSVRKRRRRAPAGGAADDCFTCTKRGVKCDRRRPYCSQCLEVGNECSGYKTQLTWGVGVASRGKLRGLSLPIAKSPPVAREPKKTPARARATSSASTASSTRWMDDESRRVPRAAMDIPNMSQPSSGHSTPYPAYDYLAMSHQEPHIHHSPQHQYSPWTGVGYHSPNMMYPTEAQKMNKYPFSIVTDGLSGSMDGSDVDYMSPIGQAYPREDLSFVTSPSVGYDSYHGTQQSSPVPPSPPTGLMMDGRAPTSCPGLVYAPSEPSSSLSSHIDPFEGGMSQRMQRDFSNMSSNLGEPHMMPVPGYSF